MYATGRWSRSASLEGVSLWRTNLFELVFHYLNLVYIISNANSIPKHAQKELCSTYLGEKVVKENEYLSAMIFVDHENVSEEKSKLI